MRIIILLLFVSFCGCNNKKPSEKEEDTSFVEVEKVVEEEPKEDEVSVSWDNAEIVKLSVNGYFPQFVPSHDAVIYSAKNFQGLWMIDLVTEQVKQLTDKKGAGYQPVILENKVIYEVKARLSYLEEVNISTGEIQKVEDKYSRYSPMEYANVLSEQNLHVALSSDLLAIEIKRENDETAKIAPKGAKNYISVALSPNQSDILYNVAGLGAFISDLEGKQSHSFGDVDQPSWVNESQIVYAISKDDGMRTLSSEVFVHDLKEDKKYHISQAIEDQVENPMSNDQGNMLLMNSQNGSVYLIKN